MWWCNAATTSGLSGTVVTRKKFAPIRCWNRARAKAWGNGRGTPAGDSTGLLSVCQQRRSCRVAARSQPLAYIELRSRPHDELGQSDLSRERLSEKGETACLGP